MGGAEPPSPAPGLLPEMGEGAGPGDKETSPRAGFSRPLCLCLPLTSCPFPTCTNSMLMAKTTTSVNLPTAPR